MKNPHTLVDVIYNNFHKSSIVGLTVSIDSVSATSVDLSWTLGENFTADAYSVSFSNTDCLTESSSTAEGSGSGENTGSMTFSGLEEGTQFSITVTATLNSGEDILFSIPTTTLTVGQ